MPRLVRRPPLTERIKAYLDPYDLLLWLSEELNDDTYDEWLNAWATPVSIGLNLLFIIARGASKSRSTAARDDVFGDPEGKSGSGWLAWFALILVQALTVLCCANALYTFMRKRHYRLFEHSVDETPATTSAHRVRADSSPASASPFRFVQNLVRQATANSRAHPDPERDVWELRVWDPKPFNLKVFTLFSPGHVLLYYSLLPPAPLDPRPSVTVLTAVLFGSLLSLQLVFLRSSFTQQARDQALVHGEVMHEYNTKFVQPTMNHPVRDVGTQTRDIGASSTQRKTREVDLYPATTIIKRGFKVNPNPNYANLYNPTHASMNGPDLRRQSFQGGLATPSAITPSYNNGAPAAQSNYVSSATSSHELSSPLKQHRERLEQREPRRENGGRSGIHDHAASPLRTASSRSHLKSEGSGSDARTGTHLGRAYASQTRSSNGIADAGRRRTTGQY